MKPKELDPQRVILVPAAEDALELGVGAAADPGHLQAHLTVTTAELGQFVIPLTARQLGMLAVVSKRFLNLTAEQVHDLRKQLNERTDADE